MLFHILLFLGLGWQTPKPGSISSINPTQISANGVTTGTYCLNVVSGVVTGLVSCSGGGGGALSYSTLTNAQYTSMTNAQYTAMTN